MTKKLTQERLRALLKYDPETGVFRWLVASSNARAGDVAGSKYKNARHRTSIRIWIDGRQYKAHRPAWLYMTGVRPKRADHGDGDGTNNAWSNLQSCTSSQDEDRRNGVNNTSGVKVVRETFREFARLS